jgi:hypothetical protein
MLMLKGRFLGFECYRWGSPYFARRFLIVLCISASNIGEGAWFQDRLILTKTAKPFPNAVRQTIKFE